LERFEQPTAWSILHQYRTETIQIQPHRQGDPAAVAEKLQFGANVRLEEGGGMRGCQGQDCVAFVASKTFWHEDGRAAAEDAKHQSRSRSGAETAQEVES